VRYTKLSKALPWFYADWFHIVVSSYGTYAEARLRPSLMHKLCCDRKAKERKRKDCEGLKEKLSLSKV
jgi:hypothetical protein